jgi:hypothetical protein
MATTECGCHVNQVGGSLTLVYCPLHAAAGELLEALRHIRLIVSPALIGRDECEKLDEAIRKAEGE